MVQFRYWRRKRDLGKYAIKLKTTIFRTQHYNYLKILPLILYLYMHVIFPEIKFKKIKN